MPPAPAGPQQPMQPPQQQPSGRHSTRHRSHARTRKDKASTSTAQDASSVYSALPTPVLTRPPSAVGESTHPGDDDAAADGTTQVAPEHTSADADSDDRQQPSSSELPTGAVPPAGSSSSSQPPPPLSDWDFQMLPRASYLPVRKAGVPRFRANTSTAESARVYKRRRALPMLTAPVQPGSQSARAAHKESAATLPSIHSARPPPTSSSMLRATSHKLFEADFHRLPPSVMALQAAAARADADSDASLTASSTSLHHTHTRSRTSDKEMSNTMKRRHHIASHAHQTQRANPALPSLSATHPIKSPDDPHAHLTPSQRALRVEAALSMYASPSSASFSFTRTPPPPPPHAAPHTDLSTLISSLPAAAASAALDDLSDVDIDPVSHHVDFRQSFGARRARAPPVDFDAVLEFERRSQVAQTWSTRARQDEHGQPTAWFSATATQTWGTARSPRREYDEKRGAVIESFSTKSRKLAAVVDAEAAHQTRHFARINAALAEDRRIKQRNMERRYDGVDVELDEKEEEDKRLISAHDGVSDADRTLALPSSSSHGSHPLAGTTKSQQWAEWESRHDSQLRLTATRSRSVLGAEDRATTMKDAKLSSHPYARASSSLRLLRPTHSSRSLSPPKYVSSSELGILGEICRVYAEMCDEFVERRSNESVPETIDPSLTHTIRSCVRDAWAAGTPSTSELRHLDDEQVRALMTRAGTGRKYTLPRLQELRMVRADTTTSTTDGDDNAPFDAIRTLADLVGATRELHVRLERVELGRFEKRLADLLVTLSDEVVLRAFRAPPDSDPRRFDTLWRIRARALERAQKERATANHHQSPTHSPLDRALLAAPEEDDDGMEDASLDHDAAVVGSRRERVHILSPHARKDIVGYAGLQRFMPGGADTGGGTSQPPQRQVASQHHQLQWRSAQRFAEMTAQRLTAEAEEMATTKTLDAEPAVVLPPAAESLTPHANPARDYFARRLHDFLVDWRSHGLFALESRPAGVPQSRPKSSMRISASAAVMSLDAQQTDTPANGHIALSHSSATLAEMSPNGVDRATSLVQPIRESNDDRSTAPTDDGLSHQAKFTVDIDQAYALFDTFPHEDTVRLLLHSHAGSATPFESLSEVTSFVHASLVANGELDSTLDQLLAYLNSASSPLCISGSAEDAGRVQITRDALVAFCSQLQVELVPSAVGALVQQIAEVGASRRFHSLESLVSALDVDRALNPAGVANFLNQRGDDDVDSPSCVLFQDRPQSTDRTWTPNDVRQLLAGREATGTLSLLRAMNDAERERQKSPPQRHQSDENESTEDTPSPSPPTPPITTDVQLAQLDALLVAESSHSRELSAHVLPLLASLHLRLDLAAEWINSLRQWVDEDPSSPYYLRTLPLPLIVSYLDAMLTSEASAVSYQSSSALLSGVVTMHRERLVELRAIHELLHTRVHSRDSSSDDTSEQIAYALFAPLEEKTSESAPEEQTSDSAPEKQTSDSTPENGSAALLPPFTFDQLHAALGANDSPAVLPSLTLSAVESLLNTATAAPSGTRPDSTTKFHSLLHLLASLTSSHVMSLSHEYLDHWKPAVKRKSSLQRKHSVSKKPSPSGSGGRHARTLGLIKHGAATKEEPIKLSHDTRTTFLAVDEIQTSLLQPPPPPPEPVVEEGAESKEAAEAKPASETVDGAGAEVKQTLHSAGDSAEQTSTESASGESVDVEPPPPSRSLVFAEQLRSLVHSSTAVFARLRTLRRVDAFLSQAQVGRGASPTSHQLHAAQVLHALLTQNCDVEPPPEAEEDGLDASDLDEHTPAPSTVLLKPVSKRALWHRAQRATHQSVSFQLALVSRVASHVANEHRALHTFFAARPAPLLHRLVQPHAWQTAARAGHVRALLRGLMEGGAGAALNFDAHVRAWLTNDTPAVQRVSAPIVAAAGGDRRARSFAQLAQNMRRIIEVSPLHREHVCQFLLTGLDTSRPTEPTSTSATDRLLRPLLRASALSSSGSYSTLAESVRRFVDGVFDVLESRHVRTLPRVSRILTQIQRRRSRTSTTADPDDAEPVFASTQEMADAVRAELEQEEIFDVLNNRLADGPRCALLPAPTDKETTAAVTTASTPFARAQSTVITRAQVERLYHALASDVSRRSSPLPPPPSSVIISLLHYLDRVEVRAEDVGDLQAILDECMRKVRRAAVSALRQLRGGDSESSARFYFASVRVQLAAWRSATADEPPPSSETIDAQYDRHTISVLYHLMQDSRAGLSTGAYLCELIRRHTPSEVETWSDPRLVTELSALHDLMLADRAHTAEWLSSHGELARRLLPAAATGVDGRDGGDETSSRWTPFQIDRFYVRSAFVSAHALTDFLEAMLHHLSFAPFVVAEVAAAKKAPIATRLTHRTDDVEESDEESHEPGFGGMCQSTIAANDAQLADVLRSFHTRVHDQVAEVEAALQSALTPRTVFTPEMTAPTPAAITHTAVQLCLFLTPVDARLQCRTPVEVMREVFQSASSVQQLFPSLAHLLSQAIQTFDRDRLQQFLSQTDVVGAQVTRQEVDLLLRDAAWTSESRPAFAMLKQAHAIMRTTGSPITFQTLVDRVQAAHAEMTRLKLDILRFMVAPSWLPVLPPMPNCERTLRQFLIDLQRTSDVAAQCGLEAIAMESMMPVCASALESGIGDVASTAGFSSHFLCDMLSFIDILSFTVIPGRAASPFLRAQSLGVMRALLQRWYVSSRVATSWPQLASAVREELALVAERKDQLARWMMQMQRASGDSDEKQQDRDEDDQGDEGAAIHRLIQSPSDSFRWSPTRISDLLVHAGSVLTSASGVDSFRYHLHCFLLERRSWSSVRELAETVADLMHLERLLDVLHTSTIMSGVLTEQREEGGSLVTARVKLSLSDVQSLLTRIRQLTHIKIFRLQVRIETRHQARAAVAEAINQAAERVAAKIAAEEAAWNEAEAQRLALEAAIEAERLEAERLEAERLEAAERVEAERVEAERVAAELAAAELAEAEAARVAAEAAELERVAAEAEALASTIDPPLPPPFILIDSADPRRAAIRLAANEMVARAIDQAAAAALQKRHKQIVRREVCRMLTTVMQDAVAAAVATMHPQVQMDDPPTDPPTPLTAEPTSLADTPSETSDTSADVDPPQPSDEEAAPLTIDEHTLADHDDLSAPEQAADTITVADDTPVDVSEEEKTSDGEGNNQPHEEEQNVVPSTSVAAPSIAPSSSPLSSSDSSSLPPLASAASSDLHRLDLLLSLARRLACPRDACALVCARLLSLERAVGDSEPLRTWRQVDDALDAECSLQTAADRSTGHERT